MAIKFDTIPVNLQIPGAFAEFDSTRANKGLAAMPRKILLVGQKLSTGTAADKTIVPVSNADQALKLFGQGSMLASMVKQAFANHTWGGFYALPFDDGSSWVAATGKIVVTQSVAATGSIYIYVGGTRVVAQASTTAAKTATAIKDAIAANKDLPVTATISSNEVTLTANQKGAVGNEIDVRLNYYNGEATPENVTLAITAMASGSGEPAGADMVTALGDVWVYRYHQPLQHHSNTRRP